MLYNLEGTQTWTQDATVDVGPDKASVAFTVPQLPELSTTYFLKLYATGRDGKVESNNFYWLSTKPDEMDWNATHGTAVTPQSAYADMTALQSLAPAQVRVETKPPASPCAATMPSSARCARKALMIWVRWRISTSRVRCCIS